MADIWHADVPVPGWLRRAAIPTLSVSALAAGLWFLHEQIVWPYFEQFGVFWDLHCQADHLGWAGSLLAAAVCKSPHVVDSETFRWLTLVAMPTIAYACIVATWLAGIRSIGWIAGGTAALLTAMSPLLFVIAHDAPPGSLLPIAVACTLICAGSAQAAKLETSRTLWLIATLCGALLIAGLDVRTGVIGAAALCHAIWRGASSNARAWIATASAVVACSCAFVPTGDWSTAVVRAGVRALPLDVVGYGFPDSWRVLPYFGDWFGIVIFAMLIGGAWASRTSVLPLAVAAVFAQCALQAATAWSATSLLSMTHAILIVALAIGAVTQWLAMRSPHALALAPPAFAAAAFVATYQTLAVFHNFDPIERNAGGPYAFSPGNAARLYHDHGRADVARIFSSKDDFWADAHGRDRGGFFEPANAAVVVAGAVVMSEKNLLVYGYAIRSRDGRWSGFAPAQALWLEPAAGQCVRPMTGMGVRLYDRPVVPFRSSDEGRVLTGEFSVLDVRDAPWLPELHVRVLDSSAPPRIGWIYAQTLHLWDPESPSRADGFTCKSGAALSGSG